MFNPGDLKVSNALAEIKQQLEKWAKSKTVKQNLTLRSKIILRYYKRKHETLVAQDLGLDRRTVCKWVSRWQKQLPVLLERWELKKFKRVQVLQDTLCDASGRGAPATFTPEQITLIVNMACRPPSEFGIPITHWSWAELARAAVKEGIVASISPSNVGRFLKSARIKAAQKSILVKSEN